MTPVLLTQAEVARMLGVSVRRVRDLKIRRTPVGKRSVRYHIEDVQRYIEKLRRAA